MVSVLSLLLILVLSVLITRVASIALTHTGLSQQTARFQARSAFTGVGFTTTESEQLVNHPVRRRIILLLMLLGNAGIVAVVSSLILSFIGVPSGGSAALRVIVLVAGVLGLLALSRSQWLSRRLNSIVSRALKRYTRLEVHDYESLLRLSGDYSVSEVAVEPEDWMCDEQLKDLRLRDEGLMVLGIVKPDGSYVGAPDGDSRVRSNDVLILYGRSAAIENLDMRVRGRPGDEEHRRMVAEQKRRERQERGTDGPAAGDAGAD